MSYKCFLCGESVSDDDRLLSLTTRYGDIVNLIHEECYDLDNRDYLSRAEILKEHKKNMKKLEVKNVK